VNKAVILFSYGTAVYLILRKAYQEGHTGIPEPQLLGPPTYLYGILALAEDAIGGVATMIAVALTFSLSWAYQDIADGKTPLGRFAGTALAPGVKPRSKRTATARNKEAGKTPPKNVPKVSPGGKR